MYEGDIIKIMCRDGKPNYVQQSSENITIEMGCVNRKTNKVV